MIISTILAAGTAMATPPANRVRVTVRVLRGETITKERWSDTQRKVERTIVDESGRKILVRLIEFE